MESSLPDQAAQRQQQLHRPPVPPLKVPPRPSRSVSFSHSVFSPSPSPFSTPSFLSPSPTPKPRPRPPESPAWILVFVFHLLPLYIVYSWLSANPSSSSLSTIVIFTFLVLVSSSISFTFLQEKQARILRRSSISSGQWGFFFINGLLIATSVFLKLNGVRSCGPLVAILADYAGSVLARLVFGETTRSSRSVRGVLVTVLGLVLLSQGWTIESCSPLAIKDRLRMLGGSSGETGAAKTPGLGICQNRPIWSPIFSGILSYFVKLISTRTSLRIIPRKRVQGISTIFGTLLVLPLSLLQLDSLFHAHASAIWPLASMIVLGLARSIMGDFYFENRLHIPSGTSRHLFITLCCSCLLELLFGIDISPVGFLVCSVLLFLGVRELPGTISGFSWDSIAQHENANTFVKGPFRHIATDPKSRKIAFFLAMNAAFMVVEFISGFMSNSLGLVSDACHMLFDCAALAIGLYASYISKLQPNAVYNYGYGRFEVLSGYANAIFLVLVGSLIVLESIERILDPPEISTEKLLLVSVGGLLVNIVGLIFFHDEHHHAHHHHHHAHEHRHHDDRKLGKDLSISLEGDLQFSAGQGSQAHDHQTDTGQCSHDHHHRHLVSDLSHHHHDADHHCDHHHHEKHDSQRDHDDQVDTHKSLSQHSCNDHQHHGHFHHDNHGASHHHHDHIDHNMQGIFLHVLADTLGSVGVVISTLLIEYKGWMFTDPACSIFISALIIASVIPLLRNSGEILLQRTPRSIEKRLHEALERIRHVDGVAGFERLHVWSFTNTEIVGTLHLHASNAADKAEVRDKAALLLKNAGITDMTTQVEEI